jgi:quinoprotein glucose dehydrogenase
MRIRQEAQFELVNRGSASAKVLETVAAPGHASLARLHAIWGLGQLARGGSTEKTVDSFAILNPLLADADLEIRAQAAKVLGDLKERRALVSLVRLLADPSPRVRSLAAIALGKLGRPEAIMPLLAMLRENNDQDAHLRHAGVMGLVGSAAGESALEPFASDSSPAARMGVLLALRRQESPKVARFLKDADPRLVLEAARAINDLTIDSAMSALAELPISATTPLPLARRILAANLRVGTATGAERVASTAAEVEIAPEMRVLALEMLGDWAAPSGRDAVTGLWRPIASRSADPAITALRPRLAAVLGATSESVRTTAAHTAAALGIKDAGKILAGLAVDANQTDSTRAAALKALDSMSDGERTAAARRAIELPGAATRTSALEILAKTEPAAAATAIAAQLDRGPIDERQGAIAVLATLKGDVPAKLIGDWLDKTANGTAPPEIRLDLLEAAAKRPEVSIQAKLKAYEAARPKDDLVAANSELLAGGDPQRGARIFNQKEVVACLRCHKYRSRSGQLRGGEVGPELSDLGLRQQPAYILESILNPNKQIAQGFESIVLVTVEGKVVTGVLRGEDATSVRLVTAEGQPVTVLKENIDERKRGPSAMPADLAPKLSKMELRDLVAFLSSLKTRPKDR